MLYEINATNNSDRRLLRALFVHNMALFLVLCLSPLIYSPRFVCCVFLCFAHLKNGNHNSFSGISHFHNTWVLSVTTNSIATSTVYYEYELDWSIIFLVFSGRKMGNRNTQSANTTWIRTFVIYVLKIEISLTRL